MPARIITTDEWKEWRREVANAGKTLAVVTGTFAILQPGNLAAIREAARQAGRVCVIIHPDLPERYARPGAVMFGLEARLELASHLRAVAAVAPCSPRGAGTVLASLRPFTLVDCMAQKSSDAVSKAARELADRVVDLAPVTGCFSADIQNAIRAGRTPVPVPEIAMAAQPARQDLDRFLRAAAGRPLVTVNGCFDVLHPGHMRLLARAAHMGARLLALINDDDSTRSYKGAARPVFPIRFRLHALNALGAVSLAYPFAGDTPLSLLAEIRPDIHVKGGSFEEQRVRAERRLLASWGGRLEIIPLAEGFSTSNIVSRMAGG